MNHELSLRTESLVRYAKGRAGEAATDEALRTWIASMKLPHDAIDALPFGPRLRQRWDTAIDNRVAELTGLRDRLGHTASNLVKAAADFESVDIAAAVNLAGAVGEEELLPLLRSRFAGSLVIATGPHERVPRLDFAAIHTDAEVPTTMDVNADTDTPGPNRLRALRTEHLATLRRAEQLLADAHRLDFKRPTEYLGELERVRPGALRTRTELLVIAATTVIRAAETGDRAIRDLNEQWRGSESAVAFAGHAQTTGRYTHAVGAELTWLHQQGQTLWRLVDGLLSEIADDAEVVVESVSDSRISRIRQAVELLDDTRAHVPAADGASPWGWYSGSDMDTVTQLLYKRVWYLANAFQHTLDQAEQAAKTLLDNSGHAAVPPETTNGADWTGNWSVGEQV